MKRALSLLLVLCLCLCTVPAMASTITPFAFTLDAYHTFFDTFTQQGIQATYTWSLNEGYSHGTLEGYPEVRIYNEGSNVLSIGVTHTFSSADANNGGGLYGMMCGSVAVSAATLDGSLNMNTYQAEYQALMNKIITSENVNKAVSGETAVITGTMMGYPCVASISSETRSDDIYLTLSFLMAAPGNTFE